MSSLLTSESQGPRDGRPVEGKRARSRAPVEHLSVQDRAARGKAARADVGRSVHGEWSPEASRRDTVELLEDQAETRLQQLVPIRYGRMLVSPFTFYRGAAAVMAADLANEPRTGLDVQLCGDAHLSNFGVFAAPDRRMVFSINDFDETLPGPFEWDVKRLVASFAVAGRDRGFDDQQRHAINLAVTRAYRDAMAGFAGMRTMELWYTRLDIEDIAARWASQGERQGAQALRAQRGEGACEGQPAARSASSRDLVDGEPRIASDPPLIVPIEDTVAPGERDRAEAFMHGIIRSYRRTLSRDRREPAGALPLRPCGAQGRRGGKRRDACVDHPAARPRRRGPAAAAGQGGGGVGARAGARRQRVRQPRPARRRGPAADAGRERHHARLAEPPGSASASSATSTSASSGMPRALRSSRRWSRAPCGSTPTSAAGRSLARTRGRAIQSRSRAISATSDAFDRALATFAEAYADQNERDYDALAGAAASGRIDVETGL